MIATRANRVTVRPMLSHPLRAVSGTRVIRANLPEISRTPAVVVVVATKAIGRRVTGAYRARPALMMAVVATASATTASN